MGITVHWGTLITRWSAWLAAAGRPSTTIQLRTYQLRRFSEDTPDPWEATADDLAVWLAAHEWSPETRRSYRSALRSFYDWARAVGHLDHNPAALLPPVRHTTHLARPTPDAVFTGGLQRAEPRVQLMILLAAWHGLRRGEIACGHSADLTNDLVGWTLRVHGKGNKDRMVPLAPEVAAMLLQLPKGWFFPGQINGHLSPRWVGKLVGRALDEPGWTTHTLRHRFATRTYRGSRDLLAVQELLGHAKSETTRQYVQLPDDALRAAIRWAA